MRSLFALHPALATKSPRCCVCHRNHGAGAAKPRGLQQFEKVAFADPLRACAQLPFEMSGGMRQRAQLIANGNVAKPAAADRGMRPDDGALDVTDAAQVLGADPVRFRLKTGIGRASLCPPSGRRWLICAQKSS